MTNKQKKNFQKEALAQLIENLEIKDLAQEKQAEIVIGMTEALLKRIFVETMDKLGSEGRKEYEELSEGEIDQSQMEEFFKKKIHDYDDMVQKTIEEFKHEIIRENKQ